uniref:Aldehyde dehydrogenase domain-containing protein n=1 Tax=Glossina pallidipes TaxID=7398 RepID=A0A1A9ZHG2_GLOPL
MLDFGFQRCGHGTFLNEEQLLQCVKQYIAIEGCLASNIKCATVKSYDSHHFPNIFRNAQSRFIKVVTLIIVAEKTSKHPNDPPKRNPTVGMKRAVTMIIVKLFQKDHRVVPRYQIMQSSPKCTLPNGDSTISLQYDENDCNELFKANLPQDVIKANQSRFRLHFQLQSNLSFWKSYINGEWVEANDGERYEIKNTADGEIIRYVPNMKIEDCQKAIEVAKCVFQSKEWPSFYNQFRGETRDDLEKMLDYAQANREQNEILIMESAWRAPNWYLMKKALLKNEQAYSKLYGCKVNLYCAF